MSAQAQSTPLEESVEETVEEQTEQDPLLADELPVTENGQDVEDAVEESVEVVNEKTLTPAEKKKREDVAKAIERDNPDMPMDKKMAIATATAKKVAESFISDRTRALMERAINAGRIISEQEGHYEPHISNRNGDHTKPPLKGGRQKTQDSYDNSSKHESDHADLVDHVARHLPHVKDAAHRKDLVNQVHQAQKHHEKGLGHDAYDRTDDHEEHVETSHVRMKQAHRQAQEHSGLHSSETIHGKHASPDTHHSDLDHSGKERTTKYRDAKKNNFDHHHMALTNALQRGDHKGAEEHIAAIRSHASQ